MKTITRGLLTSAAAYLAVPAFAQAVAREYSLDIERQPLAAALTDFSKQTGLQVGYFPETLTESVHIGPLSGRYTADAAIAQLLLPSGLSFKRLNERTIAVAKPDSTKSRRHRFSTMERRTDESSVLSFVRLANVRLAEGPAAEEEGQQFKTAANAREPDGNKRRFGALEEVIVTAQKRQEQLIEVPMSITALSGGDLTSAGINNAVDLSYAVPGMTVTETGPGRQVITIRGIGSTRGTSSLTGVYLDEMPVSGAQDGLVAAYADLRTIDLERVEVLKGPQGTLFGEGAAGGVVRFITKDPDLSRFGGDISTEFYNTVDGGWSEEVTGVVNVPLASDVFGIRIAAKYENKAGWIDQPSIGREDINDNEVKHVRVKALYMPNANLQIKGLAEIHRNKGGASNIVNQEPRKDSNFLQAVDRFAPTDYVDDYDMFNLAVTYDFGFAELLSSTSYAKLDSDQSFTQLTDGEPTPFLEILNRDLRHDASITSQEFRLTSATDGRFNWTIGASYKDADLRVGGGAGTDLIALCCNINRRGVGAGLPGTTTTSKSVAGFADVSYEFADRFEVGGGLRQFSDDREIIIRALSSTSSADFDKTTGRVYVKYKAAENVNLYVTVGSGFRSGGFNGPAAVTRGAPPSYGEENTLFYELGTKMSLLDGRVRFTGAMFYGDYEGMQEAVTVVSPVDNAPLGFTQNDQDGELKGVEWDIGWAATERLTLALSGDVIDSEITKINVANRTPAFFVGDPINLVPKHSVSASADYQFEWSSEVPGFVLLSFNQQGKHYFTSRSAGLIIDKQGEAPELNFLNASVGAEWSGWRLGVFGRNLLDEEGAINATETGWSAQARPRTLGITMSKTF